MTKFYQILLAAAAVATLAGCSKYDEAEVTPGTGNTGKTVKIYADVTGQDKTRADITVGSGSFSGAWEDNDNMGVLGTAPGTSATAKSEKFIYSTTEQAFSATPAWTGKGAWKYYAFAPYAEVAAGATKVSIPFGNHREQTGSKFNSNFDALVATPREMTDAESGMADDGKAIAFKLNRLTPILHLVVGGSKTEKVKALLLTAPEDQPISAATLDFDAAQGEAATAALSTTDASNVIAVTYPTDAPAANAAKGIFNIPARQYNKLTLEVITEDNQIGTVELTPNKAFDAGTLYNKTLDVANYKAIDKPSLNWPGHDDLDAVNYITTVDDGNGNLTLDYSAAITINVPGGIAGLSVDINSEALNGIGITTLNLFEEGLGDLVSGGVDVQYKKSTVFDITPLVPMILAFTPAPGSDHIFTVTVTDLAGQVTTQALTFRVPGPIMYNNDANLWANTASFSLKDIPADATSVTVEYKKSTETAWQTATVNAEKTAATIAPVWEDKTAADWSTPNTIQPYSRIKAGTGIFAGNTYDYKLTVDGTETAGQFTTIAGNTITDGSLETSWKDGQQFNGGSSNYTFWGSGYNSFAKELCVRDAAITGRDGTYCAKLNASYNTTFGANIPAPGNLFTGNFKISVSPMGGYVTFGKKYTYNARPTAIKFKYHAKVGLVNYNLYGGPLAVNEMDKARVMVCIVDWSAQQEVFAGKKAPTGTWDPEKQTSAANGPIIGYASKFIEETTPGDAMVEVTVPINYYQKTDAAPSGNFNIVINASTSAFGDYMNACTENVLYLDDFQWVY